MELIERADKSAAGRRIACLIHRRKAPQPQCERSLFALSASRSIIGAVYSLTYPKISYIFLSLSCGGFTNGYYGGCWVACLFCFSRRTRLSLHHSVLHGAGRTIAAASVSPGVRFLLIWSH